MLIRPLSSELAEKAKNELNETPEKLKDGIQHLKEWIEKQPHLKARTDDQWLAAFLRGCKYRLEQAKEKMDLYYSLRTIHPDLYAFKPGNPQFTEMLKTGSVLVLPKLSSSVDPRITIVRLALCNPKKFGPIEFYSLTYILQQIMFVEDDALVINGNTAIIDFKGATLSHFFQLTPRQLKRLLTAVQDASPLRLKGLHIINCLPIFAKIFNFVKSLLNEKHRKRIFVYSSDMSTSNIHIPTDILPAEYGGSGGTAQDIIDYWLKKIEEYGPWLEEDKKYGTDESLRPAKSKDRSFEQLEID